jgi:hypothetical protein
MRTFTLMVCAVACAPLAACQLNDTGSAPPAPDLPYDVESETSESTSPAQTAGRGATTDLDADSGATADGGAASATPGGGTTPPANDGVTPGLGVDASVAASFDAAGGVDASLPVLPLFEAGMLIPGNFGPLPSDASLLPGG